jgi:hypothetical protein
MITTPYSTVKKKTHVRNSESSKIVSLVLATAAAACSGSSSSSGTFAQMRRNIASTSSTQTASRRLLVIKTSASTRALIDRRHSILERTTSREMLSLANTTFDLLILQLLLNTTLLSFLLSLLGMYFPVNAGTEDDIFADRGGIKRGTGRVALFESKFAPCPSLGDLWVYVFLDNGCADSAGDFDFFAVVVEAV